MKKLHNFVKNNLFVILLIFISVISHFSWFLLNTTLSHGDWYYWPTEFVKELYYSFGSCISFFDF